MYIRKIIGGDFSVPILIGKIMQWYGFDPIFRGKRQYVFLRKDIDAIKLPFYMKFIVKYGELRHKTEDI